MIVWDFDGTLSHPGFKCSEDLSWSNICQLKPTLNAEALLKQYTPNVLLTARNERFRQDTLLELGSLSTLFRAIILRPYEQVDFSSEMAAKFKLDAMNRLQSAYPDESLTLVDDSEAILSVVKPYFRTVRASVVNSVTVLHGEL